MFEIYKIKSYNLLECAFLIVFLRLIILRKDIYMNSKKIIAIVLTSLALGSNVFSSVFQPKVFADEIIIQKTREERSASGVAVFFAGIVVAWVVDGSIQYVTGKAPSEWVAMGLSNVENYIKEQAKKGSSEIIIPKSGPFTCPGVVIDHSGMCG